MYVVEIVSGAEIGTVIAMVALWKWQVIVIVSYSDDCSGVCSDSGSVSEELDTSCDC